MNKLNLKYLFLSILITIVSVSAFAQLPEIPENYSFKKDADYKPHQEKVFACMHWIVKTHPEENYEYYKKASDYAMAWITGTPDLYLAIETDFMFAILKDKKYKYAGHLSSVFLFAKAIHVKNNSSSRDKFKAVSISLQQMIDKYLLMKEKDLTQKSKVMEKYIKLKEANKLDALIQKELDK